MASSDDVYSVEVACSSCQCLYSMSQLVVCAYMYILLAED